MVTCVCETISVSFSIPVLYCYTHRVSSSHKHKFISSHTRKFYRRIFESSYRLTYAVHIVSHTQVLSSHNRKLDIVSQTLLHRLTNVSSSNCIVSHTYFHRLTDVSSNRIVSQTQVLRTASSHRRKSFELHRLTDASSSSHRR